MKIKENIHKILSIILVLSLVLPAMPMAKVEASDIIGGPDVVSGSAIRATVNTGSYTGTEIDVSEGDITINNRAYEQKIGSVVVNSGTIDTEYVIFTGAQSSPYAINISGSDIPNFVFRNARVNGEVKYSKIELVNITFEGQCFFDSRIIFASDRAAIVNMDSVAGAEVTMMRLALDKGSSGYSKIDVNMENITFYRNDNFKSGIELSGTEISSNSSINIENCNFYASSNMGNESALRIVSFTNATIKNVYCQSLGSFHVRNLNVDGLTTDIANSQTLIQCGDPNGGISLIKNSSLNLYRLSVSNKTILKIEDSTLNFVDAGQILNSSTDSSVRIYRSTINVYSPYTWFTTYTDSSLLVSNSSLYSETTSVIDGSYGRFKNLSNNKVTDPINKLGRPVFLNKLKVPNNANSLVTVKFDDGETANLYTDKDGLLWLYLESGKREISVTDPIGIEYKKEFEAANKRDTPDSDNYIGELETQAKMSIITFIPYANKDVEYSFNRSIWNPAKTDQNCQFSVLIPDGVSRVYLRVDDEYFYAEVNSDGTVGDIISSAPLITNQSPKELQIKKGYIGKLFVIAESFNDNGKLTYQWYMDGKAISGAVSNVYTIAKMNETNEGVYTCVVTENEKFLTTSEDINVTIANDQSGTISDLEKEIADLQDIITQLQADKSDLQQQIDSANTQINDLTTQISHLQGQVDALTSQLGDAGANNSELLNQIKELNDQITNLNNQITELTNNYTIISNEKTLLEIEVTNLTNMITELESALLASEEENTRLLNQLKELQDIISGLNNDIDSLTNQNNALIEQVESLTNQKATLENEINRLLTLLDDANSTIARLTEQVNNLTNQLEIANNEKENLQNTVTGLENQITNLNNQINDLNNQVAVLEEALHEEGADKDKLNQTIQDLNDQISSLNHYVTSLETELTIVTNERNSLQNTVIELNNNITSLNNQITILEGKLAVSEEENELLLKQLTELKNTVSGLNNDIINLQNEITSLTTQNNSLVEQVESLTNQKAALENEVNRLLALLDDANNTIDRLTEQVNNLTSQLEAANNEKITLQNTITGLENQIDNLNNQIYNLNNQVSVLEEALQKEGADKEKLNQTIQDLNEQISSLNQIVSSLQTELNTVTDERNSLQNIVTNLNNDITNLNNQITILEGKLAASEEENAQLLKQLAELQNIISGLENNITDLQREVDALNNSNRDLQGQLDIAKSAITTLNNLLFLIKSELGVVDDDEIIPAIKQLKAQLLQEKANNILLQQQMNELDKELIAVKENNSSLKEKLKELMELVGSKDEDGIKDKIIDLQFTLSESEQTIIELQKEKNELINKLQEAENLNKELQKKIDELLELSGADTEELKKQILDLTSQINKLIENNNSLHNSIRDLNSKVSELNSEKATLESEIVRLETLLDTANSTIDELREQLADMAADKTSLENENAELKKEIERLKQLLENSHNSGGNNNSGGGSGYVDNSKKEKELQDKLDETLKELEDVKKELEELKKSLDETGSEKESEGTNSGKDDIKIPEDSVVVLPAEKVEEPVIKESAKKPVTKDKITAQEGWELAPTLDGKWEKEINLTEAVGTSNIKNEIVGFNFYARKEAKPEQVYNYSVEVKKPSAIPNFTMDKIIYLGNDFKLNLTNVTKDTKVTYKSLNNSIATVNKNGVITPKKSGKTTITGTAYKDGVPYQFTVNVTVKDQDRVTSNLKEQTIQTASSEPVLVVYKLVYKDSATKLDINGYADDAVVSYTSSDSTIATVNKDGVIKGIKKGRATITATIVQNNKVYNYILIVRVDDGTPDTTVSDYLL